MQGKARVALSLILLGVAGLALGGAGLIVARMPVRSGPSRTMQAALSAAQRNACARYQVVPGSYAVVLQQEYPGTAIVFYAAQCTAAGKPPQAVLGYVARASDLGPGQASCGGGSAYDANSGTVHAGGLVTVTTGFCPYADPHKPGGFSLVWGEVTAAAGMVDVTFADGRVVRTARSGPYFAAVVPQPVEACRLHVLDHVRSLLSEQDLRGRNVAPLPASGLACP